MCGVVYDCILGTYVYITNSSAGMNHFMYTKEAIQDYVFSVLVRNGTNNTYFQLSEIEVLLFSCHTLQLILTLLHI